MTKEHVVLKAPNLKNGKRGSRPHMAKGHEVLKARGLKNCEGGASLRGLMPHIAKEHSSKGSWP